MFVTHHDDPSGGCSDELAEVLQKARADKHVVGVAGCPHGDGQSGGGLARAVHAATAASTLSATQARVSRPAVRTAIVETSLYSGRRAS